MIYSVKFIFCIDVYGENMKRLKRIVVVLILLMIIVVIVFVIILVVLVYVVDSDILVLLEIIMFGSLDGILFVGNGLIKLFIYFVFVYVLVYFGINLQGVNNFSCKLCEGQNFVVLFFGINFDVYVLWLMYVLKFIKFGYCVFFFNFNGFKLLLNFVYIGDICVFVKVVFGFVDCVFMVIGFKKVDFIGWFQGGGLLLNYYIIKFGGDKKVSKFIVFVLLNYGVGF